MVERVQTLSFMRGRLPHWLVAGHADFVTLCRKGCLPERVVEELRAERSERAAAMRPSETSGHTVARDVPDRTDRAQSVARDVPALSAAEGPDSAPGPCRLPTADLRPPTGRPGTSARTCRTAAPTTRWRRSVSYTVNNPVKAGLCASWRDWSHTVADPEVEGLLS